MNADIDHRARHIILLTREWIKNPFNLEPILYIVIFRATIHPIKGKGAKVTLPTFPAQSLVRPVYVLILGLKINQHLRMNMRLFIQNDPTN